MKAKFEIYYEDLTEAAQHYLCKALKTTPEKENWADAFPLAVIERELKKEAAPQPEKEEE